MSLTRTLAVALVAAGLTGTALVLTPSVTAVQDSRPVPSNIAVVDLEKAFNSLTERTELQTQLQGYLLQLQEDLKKLDQQAKDAQAAAQALPDGPDKMSAIAKAAELTIQVRTRREVSEAMVDQRTAAMFKQLAGKIQGAAKKLAEQRGYTMVISTDESVQVPASAGAQEANRIIATRRLLFSSPQHDVTNDLVALLNTEYASGKR
jgi:Skp family chaperone for outer membrane proteins